MEHSAEFEQAMLVALKSHKPKEGGLIRRLWHSIRSLTSVPHPVEERRTVPRLVCELPVVMLMDGGAKGGTLTDVGLFGLSVRGQEPLPKGKKIKLLLAQDRGLEEVFCRVRWCDGNLMGFQYHQEPGSLSRSWVCTLLHELGYDFEQRRQFIRAKSEIPARLGDSAGIVMDIGVGGALFEGPGSPESTTLHLGPFQDLPEIALDVQIKNHRQKGDSELWSLEFTGTNKEQTSALGKYVLHLLAT